MENEIIVNGKRVKMTHDNIEITPLEAPKSNFLRTDSKTNYAFSHPTSVEEVERVFKIMTKTSKIEKIANIARSVSNLFKFPEELSGLNIPQSYTDSLPLPFTPEYIFIRPEEYKPSGASQ
jgi:hypothetical protein